MIKFNFINENYENLLVMGVICSLFTKLRFFNSPIGIGEIIIVFLGIFILKEMITNHFYRNLYSDIFIKFWLLSLLCLLIGYNLSSSYNLNANQLYAIHDIFAYLFLVYFISILIYIKYKKKSYELIMGKFIYFTILLYILMYLYIMCFDNSFVLAERFFGLSKNPNQIALVFTIIPFLIYHFGKNRIYWFTEINYKYFLLFSFFLVYIIKSDALYVSIFVAFFIHLTLISISLKHRKIVIIFAFLFFGILIYILLTSFDMLNNKFFIAFVTKDVSVRFTLYLHGLESFTNSVFFGLGPGPHSWWVDPSVFSEAHNVYIDWLTQVGMIGFLLFICLLYIIIRQLLIKKEFILVSALVSLLVFSFFHMTFRQPIFWFYLFYFYSLGIGDKKCVE